MTLNAEPLDQTEKFLRENELFTKLEVNEESKPVGKLREIDLSENEIWFLQCPKGMDIASFESQKLKIPGRTNIKDFEAISMEFNNGKEQHAFAYYSRKGRYSLRLLPIRGSIVIRDRLKAADTVTSERVEEYCSPAKRVPLPSTIRVRHPLLGAQYNDKVCLDDSIKKRLQDADEDSTKILKECMSQKLFKSPKTTTIKNLVVDKKINKFLPEEINSEDEGKIEFISEEKINKKNKSKRKNSEDSAEKTMGNGESGIKKKKSKKSKIGEIVSEDLQWLQNI